jgi:hypothetical protein
MNDDWGDDEPLQLVRLVPIDEDDEDDEDDFDPRDHHGWPSSALTEDTDIPEAK